jgi:hypothetical protein
LSLAWLLYLVSVGLIACGVHLLAGYRRVVWTALRTQGTTLEPESGSGWDPDQGGPVYCTRVEYRVDGVRHEISAKDKWGSRRAHRAGRKVTVHYFVDRPELGRLADRPIPWLGALSIILGIAHATLITLCILYPEGLQRGRPGAAPSSQAANRG